MAALVPLIVAVPLLAAAAITAVGHVVSTRLMNVVALVVAAAVTGMGVVLLLDSWGGNLVYWFAGWEVRGDTALGIAFVVDPFAAALAAFAGLLATGSLAFSWRAFREQRVGSLFYALMLVFIAGMVGFALTGDLFNLFVFFELMSVAAYALTAYEVRRTSVLQGALAFAITNSIGAFMILFGIALLYGETAALNLADLGAALQGRDPDGAVVAGFALIVIGFLVKAGAVPFHFWLSDAYAVAPTPVAVLLSAIMSDLSFLAIAKIYWTVFAGVLGDGAADGVRATLVAVGVLSALVGGVMCLLHGDLKRVLAFVTVAHGGIFLVGVGLLSETGLAGSMYYVVADGFVKGALLLGIGGAIYLLGGDDESALHGRGRRRRWLPLGAVFALGGVGLAAAPPFGPFVGKDLILQAAQDDGLGWVAALLTASTVMTAASVLRAAGRVFLGLGAKDDPMLGSQPQRPQEESPADYGPRSQAWLVGPALLFLIASLALPVVPDLAGRAELAAARLMDQSTYIGQVLRGAAPAPPPAPPEVAITATGYAYGSASAVAAVVLALLLLERHRVPRVGAALGRVLQPVEAGLRAAHGGAIGDYVTWLTGGASVLGIVWLLTLS